jgi:Family of unknown function (DUF6069)
MTTTANPTLTDTDTDTGHSSFHPRRIALAGAVSGVVAAVATTVVVMIAEAAGAPMEAAPQGAALEHIPLAGYAQLTLMCVAIGVGIAIALARWAKRPARTFLVVTLGLTVLSFAPDLTTQTTTATRLVLMLTHVVAAAIVIPAIARRLPAQATR